MLVLRLSTSMDRQVALASGPSIDEEAKRAVLKSTVQIRLVSPVVDVAGIPLTSIVDGIQERQVAYADGLGSLVMIAGEHLILTHDHWSQLTIQLLRVEFYDASGNHLTTIEGSSFWESIRFRNGSTMLLDVPPNLQLSYARVDNEPVLPEEDLLLVAYRPVDSPSIEVMVARLEQVGPHNGQTSLFLSHQNGEIVAKGSSGGGVWHGKELVGNLWARIVQREILDGTDDVLGPAQGTSLSIAAKLPTESFLRQN